MRRADDDPGLMTTREVQELLRVSRGMLYRIARRDRWDVVKMGRCTRWKRRQVLRTIESRSKQMR